MGDERLKGDQLILRKLDESFARPYSAEHANPNVLRIILEIQNLGHHNLKCYEFGCGAGALGTALLQNQIINKFAGCDTSAEACQMARTSGLDVQNSTCEMVVSTMPQTSIQEFNLFIYADVLEHLVDPWSHLKELNRKMNSGSWIVVSVPCFFHHSNLSSIGKLDFEYEEWGVMDITHLRHYGLKNIISMLKLTGFVICKDLPLIPSFDPDGARLYNESKDKLPVHLNFGDMQMTIRDHQQLLQISAYQFIIAARKQ